MSRAAKNMNHGLLSSGKNVESCSPDMKSNLSLQMPENISRIPSPTKSAADKARVKIK